VKTLSTDEARKYVAQVASHRGWTVNPDTSLTGPIVEGLSTQSQRFGKPYCPCREIGERDDSDIVCPCLYAAADLAEHGQCYCGLFLTAEKSPAAVGSIPERRPEA